MTPQESVASSRASCITFDMDSRSRKKNTSWLDRGATFFFGLMIFYKENQRTSAATLMFYKENQCTSGATLMFYKENQCTSVYFLTFTKENRRFFTLLAQTEVRVIRVINFPNQYSSFLNDDHPYLHFFLVAVHPIA